MATIIEMPKLSDTMSVGTLISWLKKEGDSVEVGDMLAEVETDKATMELENFEDGVLLKCLVKEGEQVPIGGALAVVGEKGESFDPSMIEGKDSGTSGSSDNSKKESPKEEESKAEKTSSPEKSVSSGSDGDSRVKASPLAKKIAREKGVALENLQGSGPGGRIVKADVLAAAEGGQTSTRSSSGNSESSTTPAISLSGTIAKDAAQNVSGMRATIARRLVESKTTIPHFYLQLEVNAAPLGLARKRINGALADLDPAKGGIKLTVNDLILKAVAEALRRVPSVNASWEGNAIRQFGSVHLAFGVAVDDGLVTPVIRDAHLKTVRQISVEAKELIGKARSKKLKPEEMSGSTFTITNLGMFGITNFYGIINPPNAGILSVGATEKKPVIGPDGSIIPGERMSLGFAGDHRVVDGAAGAMFLAALRDLLETPESFLV